MRLGENGVFEFFDFTDDGLTKSWLVDENGGMSDQMLEDLYGDGGIVLWIGAGLSALEHHANVMLGTHVFGKAGISKINVRSIRCNMLLGSWCVGIGICVGRRRDIDGRNAWRVGRNERIWEKGRELFAVGPLFFVYDFADRVAHNGVRTTRTLGTKKAGNTLGGNKGSGANGTRHG